MNRNLGLQPRLSSIIVDHFKCEKMGASIKHHNNNQTVAIKELEPIPSPIWLSLWKYLIVKFSESNVNFHPQSTAKMF